MSRIRPHTLGLAFGSFLALWHLVWSLMVALGVAQQFMDMVFTLHMIVPPYLVEPFSLWHAVGLIAFTAVFGYVIGWVAGNVWNRCVK